MTAARAVFGPGLLWLGFFVVYTCLGWVLALDGLADESPFGTASLLLGTLFAWVGTLCLVCAGICWVRAGHGLRLVGSALSCVFVCALLMLGSSARAQEPPFTVLACELTGSHETGLSGSECPQPWPAGIVFYQTFLVCADGGEPVVDGGFSQVQYLASGAFPGADCSWYSGSAPGTAILSVRVRVWSVPAAGGGGGAASAPALTYSEAAGLSWQVVGVWVAVAALMWLGRLARA